MSFSAFNFTTVLIDCVQAGEIYVLYVARGHASYLKSWLADPARGL